jgi:hypothetical protein
MNPIQQTTESLLRWTKALTVALALAGCGTDVVLETSQGSSTGDGAMGAGGAMMSGGVPGVCPMGSTGVLVPDVAEANSDELRPGRPAVAADGERFLVVSPRITGSYQHSVVAGALVSQEGTVDKTLTFVDSLNDPVSVDVGFDGSSYLVVFAAQDSGLQGVRLSPDGAAVGGPFAIASSVIPSAVDITPPALGGGTYLVVYTRFFDGSGVQLYGRRISPAGAVSPEILIADAAGGPATPAVDFDGTNFLVVWQDRRGKADYADTDIYAARLAPDGTVLDPSGIAITIAPGTRRSPHVAFDGTRHIIAWFDVINPSFFGEGNIWAARLGASGVLLDGPPDAGGYIVNAGPNLKDRPRVISLAHKALVTWGTPDFAGNGGAGIFGARLDANGALIDDVMGEGLLLSEVPEDASRFLLPAAAPMGDRGLLVWLDNNELSGSTKTVRGTRLCPF